MMHWVVYFLWYAVVGCTTAQETNDADCPALMKLHFNQSEHDIFSPYIHYTRYKTEVPDLTSFTLNFWVLFDTLEQNATVFTYVEEQYGDTLISVKYVKSFGWGLEILDKKMLLRAPVNAGSWHHILVSWSGKLSGLTFWFDGDHIDTQLYTKDEVIPGGGIFRSGQTELSIAYWDGELEEKQPDEGLNGWLTLLSLDSKPFGIKKAATDELHLVKQKVGYLMSTCSSPKVGGNLIDWQTTPQKGYGSVTVHLARDRCGHF
ncbi:unnamed protein product [Meganyctiphanes norvegica]|uniref:Pentraxin (PTX) domain-containing protein n=1 Tax=Meganyctiphanes norvegica TaxID=48144 RepID=A0AAV2QJH5_MEGNR